MTTTHSTRTRIFSLGVLAALSAGMLSACAQTPSPASAAQPPARALTLLPGPMPSAPLQPTNAVGEYDSERGVLLLIEDGGHLWLIDTSRASPARIPLWTKESMTAGADGYPIRAGNIAVRRRDVGPRAGTSQLQLRPVRPVADVRVEALAATPPAEPRAAHATDLVELTTLDSTIRLEIRYATSNNFLGTRFYDEARAFMQRPAAEAVVRANQALRTLGYGLLVHDAYRPWYVTKMFWDATPADKHWLVANPAEGSKHNRGAAVDLTLFDLASGVPVEMPSTYDESTGRAFADYPGGTSLQRWHRALLRRAMEAEGFEQNPSEWWHYDFRSWHDYAIGNVPFDRIQR